jgi:alpha-beta hydrolase superfamily lysophospholipase
LRRWVPVLLLSILLIAIAVGLTPRGRVVGEALALLIDVWSVGVATEGKGGSVTRPYPGPGLAPRVADVYCDPATPPGARLVLVHGLVETGKDDTRLRTLGLAFARHRFMVVVPDLPGMKGLRVGREDIAEVRAAIEAAARIDVCPAPNAAGESGPAVPAGSIPTGVVGFSYSAGPTLIALAEPGGAPADFAVLFGGYHDLTEVILFLTTGMHRDRGVDQAGETIREGRWVLLAANAGAIAAPQDAARLRAIGDLRRRRPEAPIDHLVEGIGPAARSVLDLLRNDDPARFPALLAGLDPGVRAILDDLSPAHVLNGPVHAELFLIHGRGDAVIPYTQSVKLGRQVQCPGGPRLALLGGFRHARPEGSAAGWRTAIEHPGDSLRLLEVLAEILGRRVDPA